MNESKFWDSVVENQSNPPEETPESPQEGAEADASLPIPQSDGTTAEFEDIGQGITANWVTPTGTQAFPFTVSLGTSYSMRSVRLSNFSVAPNTASLSNFSYNSIQNRVFFTVTPPPTGSGVISIFATLILPSRHRTRTVLYAQPIAAPTASFGTGTLTGSSFSIPIDWSVNVINEFTTTDVTITAGSASVSNVRANHRSGGTRGQNYNITATVSGTGSISVVTTIRAAAVPQTATRRGSIRYQNTAGPFSTIAAGYTPTLGRALTALGGALPSNADGDSSSERIKRALFFIVPVTWPTGGATTQAVSQFGTGDFTITTGLAGLTARVVALTRQGTTSVWRASIALTRSLTAVGNANISVQVNAGALPATSTRSASVAASKTYYAQIQRIGMTITLGGPRATSTGSVITAISASSFWIWIDFSRCESAIDTGFTAADITWASTSSGVSATTGLLEKRGTRSDQWRARIDVTGTSTATLTGSIASGAVIAVSDSTDANLNVSRNYSYTPVQLTAGPTVTIGTGSVNSLGVLTFTANWSEAIGSAFTAADVSFTSSNSSVSIQSADISVATTTGGTANRDFTVTATISGNGTSTIAAVIRSGAIPATSTRRASVETSKDVVTTTLLAPTVAWTIPTGRQTGTFTISGVWSRRVSNFVIGDISVSAGTVVAGTFSYCSSTRAFSVNITPPTTGTSNLTVSIAANAVSPNNALQSQSVPYGPSATTGYLPTVTGLWRMFNAAENGDPVVTGRADGNYFVARASWTVDLQNDPINNDDFVISTDIANVSHYHGYRNEGGTEQFVAVEFDTFNLTTPTEGNLTVTMRAGAVPASGGRNASQEASQTFPIRLLLLGPTIASQFFSFVGGDYILEFTFTFDIGTTLQLSDFEMPSSPNGFWGTPTLTNISETGRSNVWRISGTLSDSSVSGWLWIALHAHTISAVNSTADHAGNPRQPVTGHYAYRYVPGVAAGYQPTFGTALTSTATAFPSDGDGSTGNPIRGATTFIVPITWPSGHATSRAVDEFTIEDVSVSVSIPNVFADVTALTRVGTTSVWRATISVLSSRVATGSGTVDVSVGFGAIPSDDPTARSASQAARQSYAYQVSTTVPTQEVEWKHDASVTGSFVVSGTWARKVGTTFVQSDITVTPSGTAISNFSYCDSTRTFTFTVTPPSGSGTITLTINRTAVTPNAASDQSTTVTYAPTPTATVAWLMGPAHTLSLGTSNNLTDLFVDTYWEGEELSAGFHVFDVLVRFNKDIIDSALTASDFTVTDISHGGGFSAGTPVKILSNPDVFRIPISNTTATPDFITPDVTVAMRANAVDNSSAQSITAYGLELADKGGLGAVVGSTIDTFIEVNSKISIGWSSVNYSENFPTISVTARTGTVPQASVSFLREQVTWRIELQRTIPDLSVNQVIVQGNTVTQVSKVGDADRNSGRFTITLATAEDLSGATASRISVTHPNYPAIDNLFSSVLSSFSDPNFASVVFSSGAGNGTISLGITFNHGQDSRGRTQTITANRTYAVSLNQLEDGFTPTLGTALDSLGNALPSTADGETGEPITRRNSFIVPITWAEPNADVAAAASFGTDDITLTTSSFAVTANVTSLFRVGSTSVWHAVVGVSNTTSTTATLTFQVDEGALPVTLTRLESVQASQTYAITVPTAAPTVTIGNAEFPRGTPLSSTIARSTFHVDFTWSENIGTEFSSSDISITSSNSSISASIGTLTNRGTGGTTTHWSGLVTVTGNGAATLTLTVAAGAIPASDARNASSIAIKLFSYEVVTPGYQPTIGKPLQAAQPNAMPPVAAGTAFPSDADGDTSQPIKRTRDFIVPVTWPAGAATTQAAADFSHTDISITSSIPNVTARATGAQRQGSTSVWWVGVRVMRSGNTGGSGTLNFQVDAGALPVSGSRGGSRAADEDIAFLMQDAAPTITISATKLNDATGTLARIPLRRRTEYRWDITLSENKADFDSMDVQLLDDVQLSAGRVVVAGNISSVTNVSTNPTVNSTNWRVVATLVRRPPTTLRVQVVPNLFPATDTREASVETFREIAYDGFIPNPYTWVVPTGISTSSPPNTLTVSVSVNWDRPIQAGTFTSADLTIVDIGGRAVTGATVGTVALTPPGDNPRNFTFPVTFASGISGVAIVRITEYSVQVRRGEIDSSRYATGPSVAATSPQFFFDTRGVAEVLVAGPTGVQTGQFDVQIRFTRTVTGFTINDFSYSGFDEDDLVLGFSGMGDTYTLSVTPDADVMGSLVISVNADAATYQDAQGDDQTIPDAAVSSNAISIDTRTQRPVATIDIPILRRTSLTVNVDWNEDVGAAFCPGDITFTTPDGSGITLGSINITNRDTDGSTSRFSVTAAISGTGQTIITMTIVANAIEATSTRLASEAVSRDFAFDSTSAGSGVTGGANVKILPLVQRIERAEAQAAFFIEFDENVEMPDGGNLEDAANVPSWLQFSGLQLPDDAITVMPMEARTITAQNAPCSSRRFGFGATYNLRVAVRPPLTTDLTDSDFRVTNGTLAVTTLGVGRLYQVAVTFPTTGQGRTTVDALAANIAGVDSNVELMTCLYGGANLRARNFPTTRRSLASCFTFDIICDPAVTATPLANSLSVTNGTVQEFVEVDAGKLYRATILVDNTGSGTLTVTAVHAGWTNISSDVELGSVAYGS